MSKSRDIVLGDGTSIPILYEDRNILAIDKPPGWMLAPSHWDRTGRNLQLALEAGIRQREFWARSRNLRFLRFMHRLDAETSGILLLAKSPGAVTAYQKLFEGRAVEKLYLAVVQGVPTREEWTCQMGLAPDPQARGRMKAEPGPSVRRGTFKPAETHFKLLATHQRTSLVAALPVTGRTHQIRVHLAESGHPVLGDPLYSPQTPDPGAKRLTSSDIGRHWATSSGKNSGKKSGSEAVNQLGLRAVGIAYKQPFIGKNVRIIAPVQAFLEAFCFKEEAARGFFVQWPPKPVTPPGNTNAPAGPAKHEPQREPRQNR